MLAGIIYWLMTFSPGFSINSSLEDVKSNCSAFLLCFELWTLVQTACTIFVITVAGSTVVVFCEASLADVTLFIISAANVLTITALTKLAMAEPTIPHAFANIHGQTIDTFVIFEFRITRHLERLRND